MRSGGWGAVSGGGHGPPPYPSRWSALQGKGKASSSGRSSGWCERTRAALSRRWTSSRTWRWRRRSRRSAPPSYRAFLRMFPAGMAGEFVLYGISRDRLRFDVVLMTHLRTGERPSSFLQFGEGPRALVASSTPRCVWVAGPPTPGWARARRRMSDRGLRASPRRTHGGGQLSRVPGPLPQARRLALKGAPDSGPWGLFCRRDNVSCG